MDERPSDYCEDNFKVEALLLLHEGMAQGDNPYKIIGINNRYYADKLIAGLTPMSWCVYNRIMDYYES